MSIQFKKKLLGMAVSAAVTGYLPIMATAQDAELENEVVDEEVVVYGLRGSMISAQDIKREANTVKDVITASDIGALPDKSVTEALMRIPGVTIERFASSNDPNHFAAEGTGVVIRGLKKTRSEINGRDSFSARRDGGGLNFEDVPPEILGRIEVVKNHTADLIAGGVAGTVNLVTLKPFDSEDIKLAGQIKASYGDHSEEVTPAFSGLFSDQWEIGDAGKIGFLFGGAVSEYKDRGDGVALDNYYERSPTAAETPLFGTSGTALGGEYDPEGTYYVPAGVAIRTSDSLRERTGIVSSLQWADSDEKMELTLEYIYSNAALEWDERVVQYGEQGFNVSPNAIGVPNGAIFDAEGFMLAGEISPDFMLAQSRWRATETDISDVSLHFKYQPTEALTLDFDAQSIESTFEAYDYTSTNKLNPPNTLIYFDTRGSVPSVDYRGANLTNPPTEEEMYINSAMDKEDDHDAEATSFAFDLEYEFEDSWMSSVQAGAYMSSKEQTIRDSLWNWGEVANSWQAHGEGGFATTVVDHPELYEEVTFSSGDFHGGGVLNGSETFLFPRMENVHNWEAYHAAALEAGYSAFVPLRERGCVMAEDTGCTLSGAYLPSEISASKEDRTEFYTQLNFAKEEWAMPVRGNLGLRYVEWEVESTGATQFPLAIPTWDETKLAQYTAAQVAYQNSVNTNPVTVKGKKFDKVLPSFNLSLGVADDQIVRVALSENVYFPEFTDFRYFRQITESHSVDNSSGSEVFTNIQFDGQTGNPEIQPEEATSMDLTYEWYFVDAGSLTFSVFKKDLSNIIRERLHVENITNPGDSANPDDDFVDGTDGTMPVNFISKTNEGSGSIQGYELSYQQFYDLLPGAWGGLGLMLNYTNVNQDDIADTVGFGDGVAGAGSRNNFRAFNNLDLPGYSSDTVNMALMYEKYGISARLAYNWRSEYLLTRRDADLFAPVIAEDTGQVDFSISYQAMEQLKVGFEATNLLDEVIVTRMMYNQAGDTTPRSYFKTDTRYNLYVSFKL